MSNDTYANCFAFAVLLGVLTGCASDLPPTEPVVEAAQQQEPSQAPVSDAEALAFAESVPETVRSGSDAEINALFDWDALLARAVKGVDAHPRLQKQFIEGSKVSLNNGAVAASLRLAIENGGSYSLLRTFRKGSKQRALFRLLDPSTGLNYHDVLLGKDENGTVRILDMYVYLSGEPMSRSMRRMYLNAVSAEPSGLLSRLTGADNEFVKHNREFLKLIQSVHAGEYEEALNIYFGLPEQFRTDKIVMLMYIRAAQNLGDETYARALDDFRQQHAGDRSVDLISIDAWILKGQYAEAFEGLDRLDEGLGRDPYLDIVRANVHLQSGNYDLARSFAEAAITEDATLLDGYWALVSVSLADRDFAATAKWLTAIQEEFGIEFEDLREVPEYSEFVKSDEFEQWSQQ